MYTASVVVLGKIQDHPNADRVKLTQINGCQVVVGLDAKEGDVGVYFPTDGQLTPEFLRANSLYRESSMNSNKDQTGMFDNNGRVRAQKFRGEVSDGFWLPIACLNFAGNHDLKVGSDFTSVNNIEICRKYVPVETRRAATAQTKSAKKAKTSIMFKEHFDTDQLGKNLFKIPVDQELVITEKLHGTSGRVGHVLRQRELSWLEKLAKRFGVSVQETEWVYLNGSRRVVLQESKTGNAFHDNTIREKAMKLFEGKLHKGETVYFEIVGFEPSGASIMPKVSNESLGKDFVKKWGKSTTYKYGCAPEESRVYVYRITQTNEDGVSFDLLWEDIVARCKELNVPTVPFIRKVHLLSSEFLFDVAQEKLNHDHDLREGLQERLLKEVEKLSKGASRLDPEHISEGVCVRVNSQALANTTFKYKSFEFKVLEGIVKDAGIVDAEEAQSEIVSEELSA